MQYLSLIPWLLFFPVYAFNSYLKMYEEKDKSNTNWFRNNIVRAFRFDILVLLAVFIFFVRYNNKTVTMMLFFMIHLYLFVNCLYDLPKKTTDVNRTKLLIQYILVALIPVIIYVFTKNYNITCFIMFAYTFFVYPIVILLKTVIKEKKK